MLGAAPAFALPPHPLAARALPATAPCALCFTRRRPRPVPPPPAVAAAPRAARRPPPPQAGWASPPPIDHSLDSEESYLQCPQCFAIYHVEAEELEGPPRVVACTACLHEWYASGETLLWGDQSALDAHEVSKAKADTESDGKAFTAARGVQVQPAPNSDKPNPDDQPNSSEPGLDAGKAERSRQKSGTENDEAGRKSTSNFNIFIGNLSFRATEEDLYRAFSGYGAVLKCQVPSDPSGASKGFGFVEMESRDDALRAMDSLQGASILGRDISLNEARPRPKSGRFSRAGRGEGSTGPGKEYSEGKDRPEGRDRSESNRSSRFRSSENGDPRSFRDSRRRRRRDFSEGGSRNSRSGGSSGRGSYKGEDPDGEYPRGESRRFSREGNGGFPRGGRGK